MDKWLTQFKLECRQLFGNWVFMLIPVLFGVWFVIDLSQIIDYSKQPIAPSQDLFLYTYSFHKIKHTLTLGIAFFIGILMIRKDVVNEKYDWLAAAPLSSAALSSAKYVVGILYLSLFTIAMVSVFTAFSIIRDVPATVYLKESAFFAVQYTVSYIVTLALAMFLAVWIKNRIVYLIGFCAWMFGTFFIDIFIISRYYLYFLKTFHLNQFVASSTEFFANEAWGLTLLNDEVLYSRLFVIAFAAMLLVTMITLLKNARPSKSLNSWKTFSIISVAFSILLYAPYGFIWKERYAEYQNKVMTAPYVSYNEENKIEISFDENYTLYDKKQFSITDYEITIEKSKSNRLDISTTLAVPTEEIIQSNVIPFTLNRSFQVRNVEINGKQVAWKQTNDFLEIDCETAVDSNAQEQLITINYAGELFSWGYRMDGFEIFEAFVRDHNVYLPAYIAWYPLPGHQFLYAKYNVNDSYVDWYAVRSDMKDASLIENANFVVHAKGFETKLYGTYRSAKEQSDVQILRGDNLEGIDLYAGNLIELNADELTVVTTPGNKLEAESFITNLAEANQYYTTWLKDYDANIKQLLYIPLFDYGVENLINETFINTTSRHNNLDSIAWINTISASLFGDFQQGVSPDENTVVYGIRQAILYTFFRDGKNLSDKDIKLIPNVHAYPYAEDIDDNIKLFEMVQIALDDGKTAHVKNVLNHFYEKGLTISDEGDEYPKITFTEWQAVWDKVMSDE